MARDYHFGHLGHQVALTSFHVGLHFIMQQQ